MRTGEVSLQLAPVNGQGWLGHFVGIWLASSGIDTVFRIFLEAPDDFDVLSRFGGVPVGVFVLYRIEKPITIGVQQLHRGFQAKLDAHQGLVLLAFHCWGGAAFFRGIAA